MTLLRLQLSSTEALLLRVRLMYGAMTGHGLLKPTLMIILLRADRGILDDLNGA